MPRLVNGLEQIFTNLGIVGSGYKLFFFEYNTTTPKTTYSDQDLTVPNPNPVECDSTGRPETDIWGEDPSQYKCVLGTPDSVIGNINPIVTLDPIDDLNQGSIIIFDPIPAAYWGTTNGTSTVYTLASLVPITSYDDKQCFFLDFHTTCGASPTLNINTLGALDLKKYTGIGTKTDLVAGDVTTQRYIAINDGVDIVILNPEHPANMPATTSTYRGLTYLTKRVILANGTDADHDIDFAAGTPIISDGSGQILCTAQTKAIDATWATGSGTGGLAQGLTVANSTKYYCFALANSSNEFVGFGFDTSSTAVNLLADTNVIAAGGTKYAYVGGIVTDGSANIRSFKQSGQQFYLTNKGTFADSGDYLITGNYGTAQVFVTTLAPAISGIIVGIRVIVGQTSNAQDRAWLIRSSLEADAAPVQGAALPATTDKFNLIINSGDNRTNAYFPIPTSDARIWYRAEQGNDASSSFIVITEDWIDTNI